MPMKSEGPVRGRDVSIPDWRVAGIYVKQLNSLLHSPFCPLECLPRALLWVTTQISFRSVARTGRGVQHRQSLPWKRFVFEETCSDLVSKKISSLSEGTSKSAQRREGLRTRRMEIG